MLSPDLVSARLEQNRCIKTNRRLEHGEVGLSKLDFSAFYNNEKCSTESKYIGEIVDTFHELAFRWDKVSVTAKAGIRGFLLKLLGTRSFLQERHVQLFLYLYWHEIRWEDAPQIPTTELFLERGPRDSTSKFCQNILPKLSTDKRCYWDISGYDPGSGTVYMIEIKRGELDDRAVGQILRYYGEALEVMHSVDHEMDIRRIVPILVIEHATLEHWISLPMHFREVLHIYYYQSSNSGIVLRDGVKRLRSTFRTRRLHPA